MVFAGILPWTFFSNGLSEASNSLISNANLISKVYFPRLIVPTATVVVAFVDFLISFCMLLLLMIWYQFMPDWRILILPAFVLLAFCASFGPALWITALNVSIEIFATLFRSSSNWASMYRRSASARALCPNSGGCFTP